MPRDWEALVAELTDVQKLVHLAMRMTPFDADRIRGELLAVRRDAYVDELTIMASQVGCPGRRGRLSGGPSLTELSEASQADGESIVNTYNWDLAVAIDAIHEENPRANRNTYARRLQEWDAKRGEWKAPQIEQYAEGQGRALAQSDFVQFNDALGLAVLEPGAAVCPVCQGWINRGEVPLHEATNNPPPYHVNCPHVWQITPKRVPQSECPNLWMGE